MDQSRVSENFETKRAIDRLKKEEGDKYRAGDDDDEPTSFWDGRDEQADEKPMYDSRAGS